MVGLPSWMKTREEVPEKVVSYLKNEEEAIVSLEAARTKIDNVKAILSEQRRQIGNLARKLKRDTEEKTDAIRIEIALSEAVKELGRVSIPLQVVKGYLRNVFGK